VLAEEGVKPLVEAVEVKRRLVLKVEEDEKMKILSSRNSLPV
jgi:hypothetical protein